MAAVCLSLVMPTALLYGESSEARSEDRSIERLRWLAGRWAGSSGDVETEELWLEPAGAAMLGLHRDVPQNGNLFFEYLRIVERDGGLVYVAQPLGRPPTEFGAVEIADDRVVFENPHHDFPQRIIYHLEGESTLVARIEGTVEGAERSAEWRWGRVE